MISRSPSGGRSTSRLMMNSSNTLLNVSDSHCHVEIVSVASPGHGIEPMRGIDTVTEQLKYSARVCKKEQQDEITSCRWQLHRAVLCGTHPTIDWPLLTDLAGSQVTLTPSAPTLPHSPDVCMSQEKEAVSSEGARITVGFGLHPWFVPEASESNANGTKSTTEELLSSTSFKDETITRHQQWSIYRVLEELERLLRAFPNTIVGEIGLDKIRGPSESAQVEAFIGQLKLAAQYQRPVSVHCVRYYGLLLQVLQELPAEHTPPAIILHGFTGSLGIAKSLLSLKNKRFANAPQKEPVKIKERLYFGIGCDTSLTVKGFAEQILPFLCKSRKCVMLESDTHYRLCVRNSFCSVEQNQEKGRVSGGVCSEKRSAIAGTTPIQTEDANSGSHEGGGSLCGAIQLEITNWTSVQASLEQVVKSVSASLFSLTDMPRTKEACAMTGDNCAKALEMLEAIADCAFALAR